MKMEEKCSCKELVISYLSEYNHKPLDGLFDGETADAFQKVISYLEENDTKFA